MHKQPFTQEEANTLNGGRLSNRWTTYHIQHRDGVLLPTDSNGEFLEIEGIQFLIDGLEHIKSLLENDIDYPGIVQVASRGCLTEILNDYSEFIPDNELSQYEYCEDNQYNRIKSGRCVYFMKHPEYKDRIKIGQTKSLYQRTKTFWNEWDKQHRPELYAVIRTPYHKQLERLIHSQLADHRITGEWFELNHVCSFLQAARGES